MPVTPSWSEIYLLPLARLCTITHVEVKWQAGHASPLPEAGHACAGSYFVLSMLDRLWHRDLTQDEAVELMEKGIEEVRWHQRKLP